MSERRRKRYSGADGDGLVADHHGPETGAPIILLHGGGQTRRAWDRTAAALAQADCLAITVDQRGHGDSDWPEEGAYRFFDFARDAAELATQVHDNTGQAPSLVGASLGGIAGLIAQLDTNQHAFSRLILVDITPRMDPRGVSKITGFMRENLEEGFATLDEAADAIRSYLPHRKRLRTLLRDFRA
ncbi:MAG: alpha/beta fold hydrolase [Pseudomonadota bacterium]